MKQSLLVTLILLVSIYQVKAQEKSTITLGTKHTLFSDVLEEDREYWISLPESYHKAGNSYKKYPILVLLDGNVHFKAISGMVDYMSADAYRSWKIPEMIVVGIQNVDRRRDYTPDKIVTVRENNSGGGEKFLEFLEEELIPELDQNYRTTPYRILFGHSLGGLLATHAYLKEETVFKAFLAIDPSFGTWDEATMDQKLEGVTNASFERFLYMATANWGKRNLRNRDRHVRLFEGLNAKCAGEFPADLEYFENESHASVPPIAFYHGISRVFEGYEISFRELDTVDELVQHFTDISERLSWDLKAPEILINQIGYNLLRSAKQGDQSEALDFFILNTTYYPQSYNAFDSLAEAYERLGKKDKAMENYKKSVELYPENEHAKGKLETLSSEK
ncbi:alpha/beta hydrolase-fold protein [Algoriphagus namhaensis]